MSQTELRELQGLPPGPLFTLPVPLSEGPPPDTSRYDLCIVMPLHFNKGTETYELSKDLYETLERIIQSIGRKYIYMYDGYYGWSRFVLIRGGTARLKGRAEFMNIKLLLDKEEAKKAAFSGDQAHGIGRIEIVHRDEVTPYEPYDYIYARYIMDPDVEHLYANVEQEEFHLTVHSGTAKGGSKGGAGTSNGKKQNGRGGGGGQSPTRGGAATATSTSDVTVRSHSEKEDYHNTKIFSKSVRIKLLMAILSGKRQGGGADVNLSELKSSGAIDAYYPIHSSKDFREKFGQHVLRAGIIPWNLPLDKIKDYFGEKIALCNSLNAHLASWAIIPALFGVGCQVTALIFTDFNRIEATIFSLFISIWAVICYEFWKRKERYTSMRWGTIGETDANAMRDDIRPSFHGTEIKSYIDGSDILYFEPKNACCRHLLSAFVVFCLMLVALSAVGGIYLARKLAFTQHNSHISQGGASIVNALVIIVLNTVAKYVARNLVEMENHRTDKEFEESLIIKLFTFSFINCYSSFYYLAFGAKFMTAYLGVKDSSREGDYQATESTAINLAMIFAVRYLLVGLFSSNLPWIKHWVVKFWKSKKKCHSTFAFIKWFFCSAVRKVFYRYCLCRIDLAYSEDTYDEYAFHNTATQKVAENLKNKAKRKGNDVMTESEIRIEQKKAAEEEEKARLKILNKYSPAEKEYRMLSYDTDGLAVRYLDQIVIFGYMTLFIAACPGAVFLGFISLMLEMRGDLWMMLHRYQRPVPQRVESIGLWRNIMEFMIIIAVCTNAGICIFTMTTFEKYTQFQRMGIFILFQYFVFMSQYVISMLIPDDPREVTIQRQRQDFLAKKLIERVPDKEGVDPLALL